MSPAEYDLSREVSRDWIMLRQAILSIARSARLTLAC